MVRPKKHLGQHFLHDQHIARKIVDALPPTAGMPVLEVGPGTGVLTQYLVQRPGIDLRLIEIDAESVAYLLEHYPSLDGNIIEADLLKYDLQSLFTGRFYVIGNFPYNISSQIFFKVLAHKDQVAGVVCMLQKEVADRLAAGYGSKTYGILSVLLQAYYDIEFLFNVSRGVFNPPPKVLSAVIRLTRNSRQSLACDEQLFVRVVKQGFNNRRKTLRNALKNLNLPSEISSLDVLNKRAEQLSVEAFIDLTKRIEESCGTTPGV